MIAPNSSKLKIPLSSIQKNPPSLVKCSVNRGGLLKPWNWKKGPVLFPCKTLVVQASFNIQLPLALVVPFRHSVLDDAYVRSI